MSRTITQGDKRSLRRIIRKHIVRSDRDFGMLRTEYIDRVEVDDMAVDLVGWADRRALRTAPAPAPSVVPEAAVERAARAMQAENAPKPDPLNRDQREEQDDATIATYRTLARAALTAAAPHLTAQAVVSDATVECPGLFVGWSAFGASYPDTVCSTSLTWEPGTEPSSPTLCDADDDNRPRDIPCPICDPEGFDRHGEPGAHRAVYRLCGLISQPAPEVSLKDVADAAYDVLDQHGPTDLGYDETRALAARIGARFDERFVITERGEQ